MKEEKRKNEYYEADGCQITIVFLRAYSYCFDYQLNAFTYIYFQFGGYT